MKSDGVMRLPWENQRELRHKLGGPQNPHDPAISLLKCRDGGRYRMQAFAGMPLKRLEQLDQNMVSSELFGNE